MTMRVVPVMAAADALRALLRSLLNLRKRLLRSGEISRLQILAQRLEILRQRGQRRLRSAARCRACR